MKKVVWGIVIVIVIVLGVIAINNNDNQAQGDTVKIGVALPLTGNVAFLGESSKLAAELAIKNAGNTKYEYELVFEDDSFDPKKTASAVSKLINIDKVLAVITFGSGTGNAANPIAENGKTSNFSLASDPNVAKGEYNFIHWTPPFKEGQKLAQELIDGGHKRVSIIDTNHSGTLAVTNAVKESLKDTGVEIVSYDLTNVGEKDFRTIINKVKSVGPDMVVLEMFSPEIEIIAKQIKELGLDVPLTSVETFEWSNDPALFEGYWFVSDNVSGDFSEIYNKEYGKGPMAGAQYVYDLVSLLIDIQEQKDNPINHADLPRLIKEMGEYDSVVFGKTKIDEDGFFLTEASVKVIKNGKVEVIK